MLKLLMLSILTLFLTFSNTPPAAARDSTMAPTVLSMASLTGTTNLTNVVAVNNNTGTSLARGTPKDLVAEPVASLQWPRWDLDRNVAGVGQTMFEINKLTLRSRDNVERVAVVFRI